MWMRMRGRHLVAALVCAAWAAPAAHAQVALPIGGPPSGTQPPQQQQQAAPAKAKTGSYARLSDEREITRWASPLQRTVVRTRPDSKAKKVTRLRYDTEDGYPEVYVALRSYTGPHGKVWLEVRLPMRPNGRKGWVPRSAFGRLRTVTTFLQISRRSLRATLYRDGEPIWSSRVGVGKRSTPTPAGNYWIREKIAPLRGGTIYGPLAFGTAAYSRLSDWPGGGVVGIHGTNEPHLIPGRPSHGCVRVRNGPIRKLGRLMPIGTPVRID
jgi:lipoprotein-anchoring transpeptidase ErfK/SrfK